MPLSDGFELSFAGIPFVLDRSQAIRLTVEDGTHIASSQSHEPPRKYQPEADLVDELNRRLPFRYLNEFAPPKKFLKGNLDMLAFPYEQTYHNVGIGEFFYPTSASRWACGRFLATSQQVKKMVAKAIPQAGPSAQEFVMKCIPDGAKDAQDSLYEVKTNLYMLPPRPLAETGGGFDGLFLVTLVDERWYWQWKPSSLKPYETTTWSSFVQDILDDLGITAIYTPTALSTNYLQPQPDSQLWLDNENSAHLLDAALANIGRTFVRKLGGTYELMDFQESVNLVESNRGDGDTLIALAGGDIFYPGDKSLFPQRTKESFADDGLGNLITNASDLRRAILPKEVTVSFPYYVTGDNPVPHSLNARYRPKRPSCWYEEKPGPTYDKTIAVTGNTTGQGTHHLHSTAKALIDAETDIGTPTNQTALDTLAERLAKDHVNFVAGSAIDESYPGIYAWKPEGINDILWTYSARARQASTRIMRQEWNQVIREFQQAEGVPPRGVGGPSVAQTWADSGWSGTVETTLAAELASGGNSATLTSVVNFPTQNRWRGIFAPGGAEEHVLMEAASGAANVVGIVHRGIEGTQALQANGTTIRLANPNRDYGVNYVKAGPGQWIAPEAWTSGGVEGVRLIPQTQTVQALDSSGTTLGAGNVRSIRWYSGRVLGYDATQNSGSEFYNQELCWIQERTTWPVHSGRKYDGQLVSVGGFSGSPIYIIDDHLWRLRACSGTPTTNTSGWHGPQPRYDFLVSGTFLSGQVSMQIHSQEFAQSGTVQVYFTVSGTDFDAKGSGSIDIGVKVNAATDTITAGTSGKIVFDAQEWDTHQFWASHSGTIIGFNSGAGIGKYDCHVISDLTVSLSGTATVQPFDVRLTICTSGGTIISGGIFKKQMSRLTFSEGTGTTTVNFTDLQLNGGTHLDVTGNPAMIEIWGENTAGAGNDVNFAKTVCSVQKVNAGGTTTSGVFG